MNVPEHYIQDVLVFFDGRPLELALYQAMFRELESLFPEGWTHHLLLTEENQIDDELLGWFREAWDFAQSKR